MSGTVCPHRPHSLQGRKGQNREKLTQPNDSRKNIKTAKIAFIRCLQYTSWYPLSKSFYKEPRKQHRPSLPFSPDKAPYLLKFISCHCIRTLQTRKVSLIFTGSNAPEIYLCKNRLKVSRLDGFLITIFQALQELFGLCQLRITGLKASLCFKNL